MKPPIQAIVLGAGGYVGGELIRLISTHPNFRLIAAISDTRRGQQIATTFPHLAGHISDQCFVGQDEIRESLQAGSKVALFSAAPHGASAPMIAATITVAKALNIEMRVVDASADFRFRSQAIWENVYAANHGAPDLIEEFSCAVPEHQSSVTTDNIAHPGCFATAALMAVVPLLRADIVERDIFLNGVTGSTGSGRSPKDGTHHPERNSNFYAYQPLVHRHAPEIAALAEAASGHAAAIHFVPHSGPFARGIHMTLQAKLKQPTNDAQIHALFDEAYGESPFVRMVHGTPRVKNVAASNYCDLSVSVSDDTIVVMCVIDNLVKGAAGGSIQWMNRLWSLPETAGLLAVSPGWT